MDLPDFRHPLFQAQEWVHTLLAGVRPDQLDLPTPCGDWDVRALVSHLHLVAERVLVLGRGGDAMSVAEGSVLALEHAAPAATAYPALSSSTTRVSPSMFGNAK